MISCVSLVFLSLNLVCEQTTFIYKGHCYTKCPERTYMLPEESNTKLIPDNSTASLHERAIVQNVPQKKCGSCHSSCLQCRGPLNHECTECATESVYREVAPNETYCDPGQREIQSQQLFNNNDQNVNVTQPNLSHKSIFQMFFELNSIFIVFIYILVVTIILLVGRIFVKAFMRSDSRTNSNDKKNYAYDRIAYDGANEDIVMQQEININISDSSEETDKLSNRL